MGMACLGLDLGRTAAVTMSSVSLTWLLLLALTFITPLQTHANRLMCGVCEAMVDEVNIAIANNPNQHAVQTRFRIDEKRRTPYARTEAALLEILESDEFVRKFHAYSIVKPHTRTARLMKVAYEDVTAGREPSVMEDEKDDNTGKDQSKNSESSNTETSMNEQSATATDATESTESADSASTASSTPPPPTPRRVPFRPPSSLTSLPLALQHAHIHLVPSSLTMNTGLVVESIGDNSSLQSEVESAFNELIEEYLDEALLMFHRDVTDIKSKLCVEVSEACKPTKRKKKKQGRKGKVKKGANAESSTPTAPASSDEQTIPTKDEL